jgi:hypothetical protein
VRRGVGAQRELVAGKIRGGALAMSSTSTILPLQWHIRPAADRVWTEWVNHDRSARVWGAIRAVSGGDGVAPSLLHAVIACAQVLSAAGAGLALTRNGGLLEPLLATDPGVGELDELQFALGEGPSYEAIVTGGPVLEADLAGLGAGRRWPSFAAAVTARGIRGAFAFPIAAGAARLGVLSVYRKQSGPLRSDQVQDALVFADAVFVLALDDRRGLSADLDGVIEAAFTARRAEVHQAAGRLAAQEHISVTDALALLRAHAYSSGLPLHRIATEVMAGSLHLENGQSNSPPTGTSDSKETPSHVEKEQEED